MTKLFADNAESTLASAAGTGNTTITVVDGSKFPSPSVLDNFDVTITQAGNETSWEIVTVTSRSGNVLTLAAPLVGVWDSGSKVEIRWTAYQATIAANPALTGSSILDFGTGGNFATTTIYGQTDISTNSQVDAWIMGVNTADHNYLEHMIAPIKVSAGNIVPGVGFDIIGYSEVDLSGQFAVQWVRTH